jgi:aminocarboxymuconate-semialdehyde decarboxylase
MIFGGVFEQFPRLRVAFAHGGGSFPFTLGRIEQGFRVRPDLTTVDNPINPRDYIGKFWVDSLVHDKKAFTYLLEVIGEDNICLGSDYPFPLGEQKPGRLIQKMDLGKKITRKLFHRNAEKWLGYDDKNLPFFG